MTKITNNAKGLQGIHAISGVVYLKPGETREVEMTEAEAKRAARLPFLAVGGKDAKPGEPTDLGSLRAKYEAKVGKRPFMGWDADTLRQKIAEAGE